MGQLQLVVQGFTKILGLDHEETIEASDFLKETQSRLVECEDEDEDENDDGDDDGDDDEDDDGDESDGNENDDEDNDDKTIEESSQPSKRRKL